MAWEDHRTNEETLDFFRGTRAALEGAYVRPRTPSYIEPQDTLSPLVNEPAPLLVIRESTAPLV